MMMLMMIMIDDDDDDAYFVSLLTETRQLLASPASPSLMILGTAPSISRLRGPRACRATNLAATHCWQWKSCTCPLIARKPAPRVVFFLGGGRPCHLLAKRKQKRQALSALTSLKFIQVGILSHRRSPCLRRACATKNLHSLSAVQQQDAINSRMRNHRWKKQFENNDNMVQKSSM